MTKKLIIAIVAGIVFPLYAIAGQPSAQITHGPYLQNLSEDEVTVVWTTDKPCKSWVEFSKKEAGKSFYSQSPRKAYASQDGLYCVDTLHRVTVKGLEKNTTYFYRVLSQEVKELRAYRPVMGSVVSTDIWKKPLTFTTLDNHRGTLSMVMVNDIHGNNELQKKLLGMAPPQDFDMVLFCGDMCSTSTGKTIYLPVSSTPPSSCSPPKSHSCTQEAITKPAEHMPATSPDTSPAPTVNSTMPSPMVPFASSCWTVVKTNLTPMWNTLD